MNGDPASLPKDSKGVLVLYPDLADTLEELIDEYGWPTVQDAMDELAEEIEHD